MSRISLTMTLSLLTAVCANGCNSNSSEEQPAAKGPAESESATNSNEQLRSEVRNNKSRGDEGKDAGASAVELKAVFGAPPAGDLYPAIDFEYTVDEYAALSKDKEKLKQLDGKVVEITGRISGYTLDRLGFRSDAAERPVFVFIKMIDHQPWLTAPATALVKVRARYFNNVGSRGLAGGVFAEVGETELLEMPPAQLADEIAEDVDAVKAKVKDRTVRLTGEIQSVGAGSVAVRDGTEKGMSILLGRHWPHLKEGDVITAIGSCSIISNDAALYPALLISPMPELYVPALPSVIEKESDFRTRRFLVLTADLLGEWGAHHPMALTRLCGDHGQRDAEVMVTGRVLSVEESGNALRQWYVKLENASGFLIAGERKDKPQVGDTITLEGTVKIGETRGTFSYEIKPPFGS